MHRIGFMQGRLTPPVDGRIQAFPWERWKDEFALAARHGFPLMEWTLDQERLAENPLMTAAGQAEIRALSLQQGLEVASLTGDLFMQAPFWKAADPGTRRLRLQEAAAVLRACAAVGIGYLVVPLVDGGSLASPDEEADLIEGLGELRPLLESHDQAIVFESDYAPEKLADFIARLPAERFGINYDIGNSASLGYDCDAEIDAYGGRILNVHVKDRKRGGTTVPLGQGDADLPRALARLLDYGYHGDFILQTARAADGDDIGAAVRYREMVRVWLGQA